MSKKKTIRIKDLVYMIKVTKRDSKGRPVSLLVPGSEGKQYQVLIKRDDKSFNIKTECRLCTGIGHKDCESTKGHILCLHQRAAIAYCLNEKGKRGSWCKTPEVAKKLSNIGGRVWPIQNKQNKNIQGWVVVR